MNGWLRRVLFTVRAGGGRSRGFLLFLMSVVSLVQVALTWMCLPIAMAARAFSGKRPPRLLVICIGGIGDVVLAVPAIQALHEKYPDWPVTLVVHSIARGFSELLPGVVDREVCFRPSTGVWYVFDPLRAAALVLRERLYAGTMLAAVLRWHTDTGCAGSIALLSRAPRRIGFPSGVFPEKAARNWLYDSFYAALSRPSAEIHETQKLALLLREQEKIDPPPLSGIWKAPATGNAVVIAPFAGKARRNWPLEQWAEVITALAAESSIGEFRIAGGPADRAPAERLAKSCPRTVNLCGALSFPQLLDTLRAARVVVGADSSIVHLASAAGVPIVVVACHPIGASPAHFNAPERFRPPGDRVTVLRPTANPGCEAACEAAAPCCIRNLTASQVISSVLRYT